MLGDLLLEQLGGELRGSSGARRAPRRGSRMPELPRLLGPPTRSAAVPAPPGRAADRSTSPSARRFEREPAAEAVAYERRPLEAGRGEHLLGVGDVARERPRRLPRRAAVPAEVKARHAEAGGEPLFGQPPEAGAVREHAVQATGRPSGGPHSCTCRLTPVENQTDAGTSTTSTGTSRLWSVLTDAARRRRPVALGGDYGTPSPWPHGDA